MTPFVQPLDAGIIRCFKAYYRTLFCQWALELDTICHGSAWTPLSADKRRKAQRLEETRMEARM
jgi:hypothetical protein